MRALVVIIGAVLFAGCSVLDKTVKPEATVVVEQRVQAVPVFHPPLPDKLDLEELKWKVLTPEIMNDYLTAYKNGEADTWVLYGLTPDDYKALAHNMAELKRLIKEQQSIILYYRKNIDHVVPPTK